MSHKLIGPSLRKCAVITNLHRHDRCLFRNIKSKLVKTFTVDTKNIQPQVTSFVCHQKKRGDSISATSQHTLKYISIYLGT